MEFVGHSKEKTTTKYLKAPRENTLFYRASIFFVFSLYVMPQYFGIPIPVFDLTIVRISIIILLVFIAFDYTRLRDFFACILKERIFLFLLPYIFVLIYTMVLRADINAFLNPFIEILELYLLVYTIRDCIGIQKAIKIIILFIYILVLLGFVEIIMQKSPFSYLVTIKSAYLGAVIRGDSYRIMSNCVHSLGYGMLLVTALPFAGLDNDKNEYNIFHRPLLLIGLIINIFSMGSRSTLGIMFGEIFVMFILSEAKYLRKNLLIVAVIVVVFIGMVFALQGTSIGKYILLQITSMLDSVFGTHLSQKYGAEDSLGQSASYRKLLLKVFKVDWLNPLLGIGRKRYFATEVDGLTISSIDNYYIAEFVRYAYPGMLSYILFLIYVLIQCVKDISKTHSAEIRTFFIGIVFYCLHLYSADSLQTLKYLYVLLSLYICCDKKEYVPENPGKYFMKKESKYVRK